MNYLSLEEENHLTFFLLLISYQLLLALQKNNLLYKCPELKSKDFKPQEKKERNKEKKKERKKKKKKERNS